MAFNPSSTIYLCNVPIDNTYQNQIFFDSKTAQNAYFANRVVKTFSDYTTIRKTLAGGGLQSSVKVESNIDDLYNCNYMYYQNANHGTRFFYAFITNLIYISEAVTEIVFETDVYQTWLFDVELKQSYVIREHGVYDRKGDNIVPEKFAFQDYIYKEVIAEMGDTDISKFGYLVATSEFVDIDESTIDTRGGVQSGVYQGLYFYYFPDTTGVSSLIVAAENVSDCIQFIAAIPEFCVSNNSFKNGLGWGLLANTKQPAQESISFNCSAETLTLDGYTPKNNKLLTSPFINLVISNHSGDEVEYNIEDFIIPALPSFVMYGDISANPSVTLIPSNYKGVTNTDFGISISGFPQCSFISDTYKLWLAKNQFGVGLDLAANIGSIIAGVAVSAGTGGAGAAIGVGQVVSGATGIANTINNVYKASKEPNGTHAGSPKNNLLTAMKKNTFTAYLRSIKSEYAKIIDDFFTMYGYQTNALKIPNVSSRPYFNYVQTANCNITGAIPDNDMQQLKAIYNNGVTLWKSTATVGDYSVDNSPQ